MARPIKKGLPYFPVETEWERNLKLFQAKFGREGIGTIILLWKWIYNEGYYLIWDDETKIMFMSENHADEQDLDQMIEFAFDKELFDKNIFRRYKILTSRGIQKRYLNGCLKRTEIHFNKKLLLIEPIIPYWSKAKLIVIDNESFLVSETLHKESKTPHRESKNPGKDTCGTQSKGSKGSKGIHSTKKKKIPETSLKKPPSKEYDNGIKSIKKAIGVTSDSNRPPGKSKNKQLRELAARLKKEDPAKYKKLIDKHPELKKPIVSEEIPWPIQEKKP